MKYEKKKNLRKDKKTKPSKRGRKLSKITNLTEV